MSIAYEMATKTNRQVTVISRDTESTIASYAAAGMLAPQSERLPKVRGREGTSVAGGKSVSGGKSVKSRNVWAE